MTIDLTFPFLSKCENNVLIYSTIVSPHSYPNEEDPFPPGIVYVTQERSRGHKCNNVAIAQTV